LARGAAKLCSIFAQCLCAEQFCVKMKVWVSLISHVAYSNFQLQNDFIHSHLQMAAALMNH